MKALPFLKWPGGKRELAAQIAGKLGSLNGRYYEPFLGGGAVFFHIAPRLGVLADLNEELVNCYTQVRNKPREVASKLARMKNSSEGYYQVRGTSPRSEVGRAARLIYLTTLSFNGIYRQNLKGEFNVPYGQKTHLELPDYAFLKRRSELLASAEMRAGDFEETTADATRGDVLYFDPPYTVAHNNNGFVKYNDRIFSWGDQERLAALAAKLQRRGCRVLVSNAEHQSIRRMYASFREVIIKRNSVIAASPAHRGAITESLFVSS
ncbi:MAG: Dam family site-specific DNA-(adenine-N6)-methyltransferase [Terracidiphilus sp.]|jgi:DNA adenine methylase